MARRMHGDSTGSSWGNLPLVVDTSAWSRAGHPAVQEQWREALFWRRFRLSPAARLEILTRARDGAEFDDLAELMSVIPTAPFNTSVAHAAEAAMRTLSRQSAGAHRIPIADYLVAAAAEAIGGAVLHYDHDYDRLAEVMEFESIWLAPPGSLP